MKVIINKDPIVPTKGFYAEIEFMFGDADGFETRTIGPGIEEGWVIRQHNAFKNCETKRNEDAHSMDATRMHAWDEVYTIGEFEEAWELMDRKMPPNPDAEDCEELNWPTNEFSGAGSPESIKFYYIDEHGLRHGVEVVDE